MRLRLALGLFCLGLPACFLFEHKAPTNVLLVVVDSLRSDAISQSLGAAETPNLQALASEGLLFPRCFAHSPATLPAHAAILSSRHPFSSGVRNDAQPIDPKISLLAEHLADAGWQTFVEVSSEALAPVAPKQGLDRGAGVFQAHEGASASASAVNSRVIPFLDHAGRETPWFAYVDYSDPSTPDIAKGQGATSADVLLDGAPLGTAHMRDDGVWKEELELTPGPHRFELRAEADFNVRRLDIATKSSRITPTFEEGRLFAPLSKLVVTFQNDKETPTMFRLEARVRGVQSLAQSRACYKRQVEDVDRAVGELVAVLKKNNLYDDTLIVVTGSHGEALGEHGITGHDVGLYDEMLRVPLILKPTADEDRRVELARRQFSLVRHIDIAPTVLELVGEKPLSGAEGRSLLGDGERELVSETHPPEAPETLCLRRDERYTLIYAAQDDRFEMYDVKCDTMEMENVFTLQGHFRSKWQIDLRNLAQNSPQAANARMGFAPKPTTALQEPPRVPAR